MDRLARIVRAGMSVLAVLAIVGLFLPDRALIERSTVVEASPAQVFGQVNRLQEAAQWFPWLQGNATVRHVLEGPGAGVGMTLVWSSGDRQLGSGSLSIVASVPYHLVRTRVDRGEDEPIQFDIEISPARGGALVTFSMEKEFGLQLYQRYLGLLLEETAGPGFEAGLDRLKTIVESASP